ncbi:response regulator [Roseateles asaccharophilus]|uniref:Diguanylate cyclase (GGDEF)-like protein n=1 Tax=Roseateles asaccharophilus TaxID=582607 RepID=A0ABU2AG26_9BURK|nr:response regulator [Roseateles asaccharophilus]MDR7334878.1 diguanylate cyclase (GGDEF)-like protein [Roseateles asaccharophilus]
MNIFLVEDSASIRRLLVRRLDAIPGMRVVGEAAGERQALALIQWTKPDVVLLDVSLANGSGLSLVTQLRRGGYTGRIAVLTAQDVEAYRNACIDAGADAFYDKASGLETLFDDLVSLEATCIGGLDGKPSVQLRDGLTGLYNEVALHERLDQASRSASRDGIDLAVYVVRLVGLADLPRETAAALAQQVAQRLKEASADADIVARSSPDQFAVVLTRLNQADQAASHARLLASLMAEPFHVDGRDHVMGIEIGMALFPGDAVSPRGLLTLAQASAFGAL